MKKAELKAFFEKIKFKYKVSILNENTLEETFHVRLSRLNVFLITCSIVTICFALASLLIIKTPLKQFLPGYESTAVRAEYIHTSIVVDSLDEVLQKQNQFIDVMKNVIAGKIKPEKAKHLDSITEQKREELLIEKPEREKEFCEKFEKEEQYNLSIISTQKPQEAFVFFKPAKGLIVNKYNPKKSHYGVDIATSPNESVLATLDGTVIYNGFTIEDGYVIVLQHENDYISTYKNNTVLLKTVGATVRAGESIAITGNIDNKTGQNHLHFELWQKGKALNPEEFIIF